MRPLSRGFTVFIQYMRLEGRENSLTGAVWCIGFYVGTEHSLPWLTLDLLWSLPGSNVLFYFIYIGNLWSGFLNRDTFKQLGSPHGWAVRHKLMNQFVQLNSLWKFVVWFSRTSVGGVWFMPTPRDHQGSPRLLHRGKSPLVWRTVPYSLTEA